MAIKNLFKRAKKSKAQIAGEMQQRQRMEREKDIARSIIFPALEKHSRSLAHAEQVCEIVKTVILAQMNKHWEDKTVGSLMLVEELQKDKEAVNPEMYEEILNGLKDIPIFEAQRILDIFGKVIGAYTTNISMTKKLSEISVDEIIK